MHRARFLPMCALLALSGSTASCSIDPGDEHVSGEPPPPEGKGNRIHDIADPESPKRAAHGSQVSVTGAIVVAVDTYDETQNGKSYGTIYVADLGSTEPYSGISLFQPSFVPGNLRVSAGDTLDLRGTFQENQTIPVPFTTGAFLVQLANPIGTFRFETHSPDPIDVDIHDLANYETGRRWLNMIVRVKDVTLQRDGFLCDPTTKRPGSGTSGRLSSGLLPETNAATRCEDPFPKAPTLVNELMDIAPLGLKKDTVLKELVGVVTFFCNLRIAPRSAADIVVDSAATEASNASGPPCD